VERYQHLRWDHLDAYGDLLSDSLTGTCPFSARTFREYLPGLYVLATAWIFAVVTWPEVLGQR
jgi:hypothetical protein